MYLIWPKNVTDSFQKLKLKTKQKNKQTNKQKSSYGWEKIQFSSDWIFFLRKKKNLFRHFLLKGEFSYLKKAKELRKGNHGSF